MTMYMVGHVGPLLAWASAASSQGWIGAICSPRGAAVRPSQVGRQDHGLGALGQDLRVASGLRTTAVSGHWDFLGKNVLPEFS